MTSWEKTQKNGRPQIDDINRAEEKVQEVHGSVRVKIDDFTCFQERSS